MSKTALTVYGANWCGDCRRAKKFLGEHRIPYAWVDITDNENAIALVEKANDGKRRIPTLVFEDDRILTNPSNAELADALGLETKARLSFYDVVIVGSGPAGLTAALYLAREGMEVLVIEKGGLGGQAGITDRLDNFPGFPDGISGEDFAERLVRQARRFGVEVLQAKEVVNVRPEGEVHYVETADGAEYGGRAVVLATGATYRRLEVAGEDRLIGAGIHFCATCDGPFYRDKHLVVVGGGNSAAEEGLFLTRFADHVTFLVRGEAFSAAPLVVDKIEQHKKITLRYNTEVTAFEGDSQLTGVVIESQGETETLEPAAVFVFIGLSPNSEGLPSKIARDVDGFITTDRALESSLKGVFAAGDVRAGSTHQAASAAGEGATVALMVRQYLRAH